MTDRCENYSYCRYCKISLKDKCKDYQYDDVNTKFTGLEIC